MAARIGYPVVVRPSYVLGGRAMEIVWNENDLFEYMETAVRVSARRPVLVDKYLAGLEAEVDAVSDGETVIIPGIMEHVERAGVHSGDSIALFPDRSLDEATRARIEDFTVRLARALRVKGLLNIQFVVHEGQVYVLEVNPRASRTVPFLTKATGIPMVKLAVRAIMGERLAALGWRTGIAPRPGFIAVKMPVFSWAKLTGVDTDLSPEMKSTGEVMGVGVNYPEALYKALVGAGFRLPEGGAGTARAGAVLVTVADRDKVESLGVSRRLASLGFRIYATSGTARFLRERGLEAEDVAKIEEGTPNVLDLIHRGEVDLVINTISGGRGAVRDGFQIRRAAVEFSIPAITSLDTAAAIAEVLAARHGAEGRAAGGGDPFLEVRAVQDYAPEVAMARGAYPL